MVNNKNSRSDSDPTQALDAWDAAFEGADLDTTYFQDDEGPTRVLTPSVSKAEDPTEVYSAADISASTQTGSSERDVLAYTAPIAVQKPAAQTASSVAEQVVSQPQAGQVTSTKNYARIQFLPALLGWLATYSLLTLSDFIQGLISRFTGLDDLGTFQAAFVHLIQPTEQVSSTSLWTWLSIAAVLHMVSFGLGGYAAARMARIAPAKQGMGVWLWYLLSIILSTLAVFALGQSTNSDMPKLAIQSLLSEEQINAVPGILVLLVLALISSLLGSLFGPKYHRKINN